MVGCYGVGVENGPLGVPIPSEKKSPMAKSEVVLRVKGSQIMGLLALVRELGVVRGKGSGRGEGIGSPGSTPEMAEGQRIG